MSKNDFLIDDAGGHFVASKNREYRKRVVLRFRVFVDFLQDNGLTTREILAKDEPVTEELKIYRSDLTEEGFQVVKAGYDKWLRSLDKGKEITNVSPLEKALTKARER